MKVLTAIAVAVSLLLGVGLLLVCCPPGDAAEGKEENCVRKDAPSIKDGLYELQYDSWVRDTGDPRRYLFGRCILAKKPRRIFIDWEKTGVSGFTDPDTGVAQHGIESTSKENDVVKTMLFYGAAPKKRETTYREAKEEKMAFMPPAK